MCSAAVEPTLVSHPSAEMEMIDMSFLPEAACPFPRV